MSAPFLSARLIRLVVIDPCYPLPTPYANRAAPNRPATTPCLCPSKSIEDAVQHPHITVKLAAVSPLYLSSSHIQKQDPTPCLGRFCHHLPTAITTTDKTSTMLFPMRFSLFTSPFGDIPNSSRARDTGQSTPLYHTETRVSARERNYRTISEMS